MTGVLDRYGDLRTTSFNVVTFGFRAITARQPSMGTIK
jgi:hypothetical protein